MRDASFSAFLRKALDAIAAEVPVAHRAIARALRTRTVSLDVDGDRVLLAMIDGRHTLREDAAASSIELHADGATLAGLLEARFTLEDALIEGTLVLRGAADDLVALLEVVTAFIHGGARSLSVPPLLGAYLQHARGRRDVRGENLCGRDEGIHHGSQQEE
jgi:hypothetical protein